MLPTFLPALSPVCLPRSYDISRDKARTPSDHTYAALYDLAEENTRDRYPTALRQSGNDFDISSFSLSPQLRDSVLGGRTRYLLQPLSKLRSRFRRYTL